jgi:hypothetical protein
MVKFKYEFGEAYITKFIPFTIEVEREDGIFEVEGTLEIYEDESIGYITDWDITFISRDRELTKEEKEKIMNEILDEYLKR